MLHFMVCCDTFYLFWLLVQPFLCIKGEKKLPVMKIYKKAWDKSSISPSCGEDEDRATNLFCKVTTDLGIRSCGAFLLWSCNQMCLRLMRCGIWPVATNKRAVCTIFKLGVQPGAVAMPAAQSCYYFLCMWAWFKPASFILWSPECTWTLLLVRSLQKTWCD